jgi:hypothetical protein
MDAHPAQSSHPESSDLLHMQVAAVVAQQAAVTEHEIRLAEREDAWHGERAAILAHVDDLLDRLDERARLLDDREARWDDDRGKLEQLGQTIAWLRTQTQSEADEIARSRQLAADAARALAAAEGHHAQIQKALERVERYLNTQAPAVRPLARAA